MKSVLSLILFIFGIGISQESVSIKEISHTEYSIYSTIVNSKRNYKDIKSCFVNDSTLKNYSLSISLDTSRKLTYHATAPHTYTRMDEWKGIHKEWPNFDIAFYKNQFLINNKYSQLIIIDSIKSYIKIRQADWDKLSDSKYYQQYQKGKVSVFSFSRVVFNLSQTEALVYADFSCGELCGNGCWYWLKKKDGKWVIFNTFETWVS